MLKNTASLETSLKLRLSIKSDEVSVLYPMQILRILKNNDKYSHLFSPNIGVKEHVIPHHVHIMKGSSC